MKRNLDIDNPKNSYIWNKPHDQCYMGTAQVKNDGIQLQMTDFQVNEYLRCMRDVKYFAVNYIKVINLDRGLVPFDLYPYQEKLYDHFNANRFSIVLASRQSGKSISAVVYLLWYAVFQPDKTIAILANKAATAREMLSRATMALENLPFFLQPGCRALNKGSVEFSNNSKMVAAATSGASIRGLSVNLLYLDEFAFIKNANIFYTATYPVITSGKTTRVIITSTANGVGNVFHRLWVGAVTGASEYRPFRVDWWDVPGRDEKWKAQTIANTSELQFAQEFSNCLEYDSRIVVRIGDMGLPYEIRIGKLHDILRSMEHTVGLSVLEQVRLEGRLYCINDDTSLRRPSGPTGRAGGPE